MIGAFTNRMLEFDEDHLRRQLEHRDPQLAVLMFGGNDMIRRISMDRYADEYRQVLQLVRRARPEMPCIVMAPLDHAMRKGRQLVSLPIVAPMVEAQRAAARSEGCAFFDTYAAMGGEGSAGRWFRQRPRLISGDLSHATFKGQIVIGEMFCRALMQAYVAYRRRTD
jgi:lysophospholipase L1-like esterase